MKETDCTAYPSPREEELHSLFKSLLRSRVFRGFYMGRTFVEKLGKHRDLVSLHRTENDLEKILKHISRRIQLFYAHSNSEDIWIGVTHGPLIGTTVPSGSLETYIWVELDELTMGQYWFSIEHLDFRQNEIILELKIIREVEEEKPFFAFLKQQKSSPKPKASPSGVEDENERPPFMENTSERDENVEREIHLEDFIQLIRQWGPAIKRTIYDFMANDINKENIKAALRYLGILYISLAIATFAGLKFLCYFLLDFTCQFSRVMQILIPIILKLIDVFIKIVGVFCTLIAMMWRIIC